MTSTPTDHDAYIAAAPERFRPLLQHLRQVLGEALPDAEELVAYGMPGYARSGTTVTSAGADVDGVATSGWGHVHTIYRDPSNDYAGSVTQQESAGMAGGPDDGGAPGDLGGAPPEQQ